MSWPLYLLNQFTDVVVVQTWRRAQFPRLYLEAFRALQFPACIQSNPKEIIHHVLEGLSRTAHLRIEFSHHVFIEG